jgi:HAD superfamily hydrolase (TIGR01549 family)
MEPWLKDIKVFSFDMGFTLFDYYGITVESLATQKTILQDNFHQCGISISNFDEFWDTFLLINNETYQNNMKNHTDSKYMYGRMIHTFQRLNLTVPPTEKLIEACAPMFNYKYSFHNLQIGSKVQALFELLKEKKYRIIMISNFPERASPHQPHFVRSVLEHYNLQGYFEFLIISGEIEISKPHPQIFQTALDKLGINPSEMVHIGDDFHADIKGARDLGIHAIWLSHREKKKPVDSPIIPTKTFLDLNAMHIWINQELNG